MDTNMDTNLAYKNPLGQEKNPQTLDIPWCGRGDLNPHGEAPHRILSPERLPIPPLPRPFQDSIS